MQGDELENLYGSSKIEIVPGLEGESHLQEEDITG